jgi:hypothetical protein
MYKFKDFQMIAYIMTKEKSDPIKVLKDYFSENEKETKKKEGHDAFLWIEHYNTWIDLFVAISCRVS